MTPTPLLAVEGLRARYSRAPVLTDISLSVEPGEIVGVFGANGAGKTTLLRSLSGVVPVCTGTVLLDGRNVAKMAPWGRVRAGMAHVPEGRRVFSALTVRENLEASALVAKEHARTSLDEVFSLFPRLEERESQLAASLSGGEQQMLAIGRALMTRPKVLLIDEMSAGLAPVVALQLVQGLSVIRERGVGVLLVEQTPHLVAALVHRVYLVEQGRLVGEGTMNDVGGADRLAELYLGVQKQ